MISGVRHVLVRLWLFTCLRLCTFTVTACQNPTQHNGLVFALQIMHALFPAVYLVLGATRSTFPGSNLRLRQTYNPLLGRPRSDSHPTRYTPPVLHLLYSDLYLSCLSCFAIDPQVSHLSFLFRHQPFIYQWPATLAINHTLESLTSVQLARLTPDILLLGRQIIRSIHLGTDSSQRRELRPNTLITHTRRLHQHSTAAMCRIEQKVYTSKAGDIKTFEDINLCERSSHGIPCSNLSRHRVGYHHRSVGFSDSASSLPSSSPITPSGSNTYIAEPRQPSALSRRPSTQKGKTAVNPELVIHFVPKTKKRRPSITVSTRTPRISTGSSAAYSDSEGSHTVPTGFPDEPHLPPYSPATHLGTPRHGRFPSTGSVTNSSGGTSSHISSDYDYDYDYDSPHSRGESSRPKTVVHNPNPTSGVRILAGTPSPYKTTTIAPNSAATRGGPSPDSLRGERSGSFRGSSRVSSEADRAYRKRREEERKYPDEAQDPTRESARQVRFTDREESVNKDKQRADYREDRRRQREESDREARRERSKQAPAEPRRQSRSGPSAVATAQEDERKRLLKAETRQMQGEKLKAEAREREEDVDRLREQQQNVNYYSARNNPPQHPTSTTAASFDRPPVSYNVNIVQPAAATAPAPRPHAPPPAAYYNITSHTGQRSRRPSSSHAERPVYPAVVERPNPFAQQPGLTPAATWDTQGLREALPSARHHDSRSAAQQYQHQNQQQHQRQHQQHAAENLARAQQASGSLHRAFGCGGYPPA